MALASRSRSATTSSAPSSIEAAREEAFGLLRGRTTPTSADSYLLQELRRRSGAGAGPYDQASRDALLTQAAQDAAAAESVQRGRVSGSVSDPSVQAAMNEAAARRQAAVQNARLSIGSQAGAANYASQGQALGQLAGVSQAQQQMQGNSVRDLVDLLSREQRTTQMPGIPSYREYAGSGDTLEAREARNAAWSNRAGGGAQVGFGSTVPGAAGAATRLVSPVSYQPPQPQRPGTQPPRRI